MSHFRLHTKKKGKEYLKYLMIGLVCLLMAGTAGYAVHSIGTARAKSRETVLIYTEEEFVQYLLDQESEEYNLNGRYQLEEDLDLSGLEASIGTNIEPFTGRLDGNGHVVSGLARPLFGVLKKAEVENLFLDGAEILIPFTYSDGERYVDGYGAVSAYAVDSIIRNCGMSGGIFTASPAEAEYQLAKASPSDAGEQMGPGVAEPVIKEETAESSPVMENGGKETGGPGTGGSGNGGTEAEGPGAEISGAESSTTDKSETEVGPGVETGDITGEGSGNGSGNGTGEGSGEGTGNGSGEGSGNGSGNGTGEETGNGSEEGTGNGSGNGIGEGTQDGTGNRPEGGTGGGTEEETNGGTGRPEIESSGEEAPSKESERTTEAVTEGENGTRDTEAAPEPDRKTNISVGGNTDRPATGTTEAAKEGAIKGSQEEKPESGAGKSSSDRIASTDSSASVRSAVSPAAFSETIGVQPNSRQYLFMKIPAVMDTDAEELMTASPSDATPSDAKEQETPEETNSGEPEYIGNPNGDIYILVTAERITAGGLVGETAGDTLIADSFALVTIDSSVETTDTYAGGITGIAGTGSRMENSYAAGLVDSDGVAAGFTADNRGEIQNCYSTVTIGTRGDLRGAFTATGEGTMAGCAYDRQMACIEDSFYQDQQQEAAASPATADESEFSLKAFNTSQMTGPDAKIPGNWYLAEDAYPQLEYFALSGQETIESCSRAAAIALHLPDSVTLEDVLEEGDLTLPGEVDGRAITWEAEGNVIIDGSNQVVPGDSASLSAHEVPEVKSPLGQEDQEEVDVSSSGMEPEAQPDHISTPSSAEQIQLKASVGTTNRNFTLRAVTPRTSGYASWEEVGQAVAPGGALNSYLPSQNGDCYEIGTPEALAWFAYQINAGDPAVRTAKVKLTADIKLDGEAGYGGSKASPLPWIPIGNAGDNTVFQGVFDGNGHTIDYMKVEQDGYAGLFARAGGGAEIRKLGIGPNSTVTALTGTATPEDGTAALVGGVISVPGAGAQIVIEGCYSRAAVIGKSSRTGAFVGNGDVESPGNQRITSCYTAGPVTIAAGGSGTASAIAGTFANDISTGEGGIRNCYWDAAATGISNPAILSFSGDSAAEQVTVEQAEALPQDDMKNGNAVALLNDSRDTPIWAYRPWEAGNDDYPVFYDGTVFTDWSQIGQQMDLAGSIPAGSGISGDPYQLTTPEKLAWFSYQVGIKGNVGIYGRLERDMDLFGSQYTGFVGDHTLENITQALEWYPIGNDSRPYNGIFEGNQHVIEGMYVTKANRTGFFGYTENATIRNMGLGKSCAVNGTSAKERALMVGSAGRNRTLIIENCFVLGTLMTEAGNVWRGGAFIGDDVSTATVRIRNCYNAGDSLGFAGLSWSANTATNCLADISVNYKNSYGEGKPLAGVQGVTTELMKSWGAAYALNGFKLDGPWTFDPTGENYPTWGTLPPARDWKDVGQAMFCKYNVEPFAGGDGSVGNPYLITTAEQLASFGVLVNLENPEIQGILMNDISLAGSSAYGNYSADNPLPWAPIGDKNHVFTGLFNGNGKVISNMKVAADGCAGMFGWAGGGAEIKGIGLDTTCMVEGGLGSAGASGEDGTAALVGAITDRMFIKNCYSRAQVIGKTGTRTGTFVGAYLGSGPGGQMITNCYAAGAIRAGTGTPGAIAGTFTGSSSDTFSKIQYCYWDQEHTSGGTLPAVSGTKPVTVNAEGKTAAEMNTALAANAGGLLEKLNTDVGIGLWSRDNAKNDGYPIYNSSTITSWADVVQYVLPPAGKDASSPGTAGSPGNPYQIRTAEHLAWFAYQVNHGNTGICGELTADINLFGGMYTGLTYIPGNASMPENATREPSTETDIRFPL